MNIQEQWFSIIAMLVGIGVFFGMLLGGVTSMLTNFDEQRGRYSHRFNVVREYLVRILLIYPSCDRALTIIRAHAICNTFSYFTVDATPVVRSYTCIIIHGIKMLHLKEAVRIF